jgi:type III secretion protein L
MRASSKIIKQPDMTGASEHPGSVVKRSVVEAKAEARRILTEARNEAEAIVENAEKTARELREAAYQEGHEASLLELHQLLIETRQRRDMALVEVEQDVLRLAVKIAEKIIGREVERDETALADMVSTALRNARQHETLVVRVNPHDLATIQKHRDRLDPGARARFLDIVADPRVASGGCVIESESGTVDAQLETQLHVMERALLARASGDGREP